MEEPKSDVTPVVAESPTVTVESLQETLKQLQAEKTKLEANWKNEQRNVSKKDQENQRLREQLESNDNQSNITKALIATLASQKGKEPDEFESEVKQKQPDLLKQYEVLEKQAAESRKLKVLQARIDSFKERTEALGLKETDDDYDVIRVLTTAGEFNKAEARLKKLEEAKQPKVEEKKVVEEKKSEISQEDKEKIALEYMKEKGLLKGGSSAPSGRNDSVSKALDEYNAGLITSDEARKRGVKFS